ncbi:MAG: GntR family transcriptional regulator [Kiritimatiellae bacterium]|nr:GntR family transcriptional regulator [Kiritimatiellia bacterium]
MKKEVPFRVDRNDARPLVRQVSDGLRERIVGGYWSHGDVLPPYDELSRALGVSQIVTRAAVRQLSAEGLLVARPRIGTVVLGLGLKQWLGHVAFICPEGDTGYFQTVLGESLRIRLNKAGYLFTRASVEHSAADGSYDFSLLDAALARSVDLAIVLYDRPPIFCHLAKRGIPYAAITHLAKPLTGAVGLVRFDFNAAVPDFVAACKASGVRKVVQFILPEAMSDAAPALRAAGIAVQVVSLKPDYALGKFRAIEEAGRAGFARFAASRRFDRDTLFFFTSEYVARGAFLAMERLGLRAPDNARVVAWANAGLGPTYFRELSRMEMDPERSGAGVADAALAFLRKGAWPEHAVIGPRWCKGETMGAPLDRQPPTAIENNRRQPTAIGNRQPKNKETT